MDTVNNQSSTFTVKGVYDDGELRFAEPVDVEGCWKLEITFVEREDLDAPFHSDPHSPERKTVPDRLEELQRTMPGHKPNILP